VYKLGFTTWTNHSKVVNSLIIHPFLIPQLVRRVLSSTEFKTRTPSPGMPVPQPPVAVDGDMAITEGPRSFKDLIDDLVTKRNKKGKVDMLLEGKEFQVGVLRGGGDMISFDSLNGKVHTVQYSRVECVSECNSIVLM
jgi:hypothetical protein